MGIPEDLGEMSIFDFACDERFGLPYVIDWLNLWVLWIEEIPSNLLIPYEDLQIQTAAVLARVVDFIGWDCSESEIQAAVDFASFDELRQCERQDFFGSDRLRPRDKQDPDSYKVRRGKIGGYVDYFTPEQVAELDALVVERLTPCLGYTASGSTRIAAEE